MNIDIISIALRVMISCIVFAYFLFLPFKSRFRYSYFKTAMLTLLLTAITVVVIVLFLTSDKFLVKYSSFGILLWLFSAVLIFCIAIKGSSFELLFIVLVILNLYVNIVAIAKVISNAINLNMPFEVAHALIVTGVLIAYMPLLWILMVKLYKQVIEFNIKFLFWKFIWVIPALTYMIFLVKIVSDYWREPFHSGVGDVVFIILWSFTSYVFFYVTLLMVIQTYKGIIAIEQTHLIASQLRMQEDQYKRLISNIEGTARLRHDWRHHLLSISGFVENDNIVDLQDYLKNLIPEYSIESEVSVCPNHVVNIILQHNAVVAKEHGVIMNIKTNVLKSMTISDIDLCIIFANLVENALEACIKQEDGDKTIEIKADMQEGQLVLMVKNTYREQVIFRENMYYSTKHEGVGIGLSSVKRVVKKNKGIMKIDYNEKYFIVYILLNAI